MATLVELIELSHKAKEKAYSPYSNFRVGCALITKDGKIFTGCNVENVSFGLSICAERTTLVKAVSEGYQQFDKMVIASDLKNQVISPCGACRQFMVEFGDYDVYLTKPDKTYEKMSSYELLPKTVIPTHFLNEEKINV
uniref:Cytidine deaminase n=1 Tax=Saccoglossus kowalevskii TaxID=10224 RepID=A0ABM0MHM3_SACKO|nr:PREDICTED: probable cytidine deaminase-like [Saccoglossus kowalevskii]